MINNPQNHPMKTKTFIATAVLATAMHASAYVISINFQGGRSPATGPDVTGTAGYVQVDNWNNGTGASGTVSNLIDSTGTSTTADVSWQVLNTWDLQNGDGNGTDQDMMSGYLDNFGASGPSDFITISEIPYVKYDVYVYFNRGDATFSGLNANDGINNNTYYGFDNGFSYAANGYDLTSDDNVGDGWTGANVFKFDNYSGSTLFLDNPANPGVPPGDWKIYVQGIQIVAPEPSSTALLGLGGLALMLRRKRS